MTDITSVAILVFGTIYFYVEMYKNVKEEKLRVFFAFVGLIAVVGAQFLGMGIMLNDADNAGLAGIMRAYIVINTFVLVGVVGYSLVYFTERGVKLWEYIAKRLS